MGCLDAKARALRGQGHLTRKRHRQGQEQSAGPGAEIERLQGNAESVPRAEGAFDFAISEYGAAIWCDPYAWISEAHRLLKPRGELVILATSPLATRTTPLDGSLCEPRLHRSHFDLHCHYWREAAVDPRGIEFGLLIHRRFSLFRGTGLEIIDYLELHAPEALEDYPFYGPSCWGTRWPCKHGWRLRRKGGVRSRADPAIRVLVLQ